MPRFFLHMPDLITPTPPHSLNTHTRRTVGSCGERPGNKRVDVGNNAVPERNPFPYQVAARERIEVRALLLHGNNDL